MKYHNFEIYSSSHIHLDCLIFSVIRIKFSISNFSNGDLFSFLLGKCLVLGAHRRFLA